MKPRVFLFCLTLRLFMANHDTNAPFLELETIAANVETYLVNDNRAPPESDQENHGNRPFIPDIDTATKVRCSRCNCQKPIAWYNKQLTSIARHRIPLRSPRTLEQATNRGPRLLQGYRMCRTSTAAYRKRKVRLYATVDISISSMSLKQCPWPLRQLRSI